jgi:hypothetical protein
MASLKQLTARGVEGALGKAERYRLLGEPCEAESICQDVMVVDPGNHRAQITRILALTDQFRTDLGRVSEAKELAGALPREYERYYYLGIVVERLGKAHLNRACPSSDDFANRALREAMAWYEKAEAIRPSGEDEAILRWNTCARAIRRQGFSVPADMMSSALLMTE